MPDTSKAATPSKFVVIGEWSHIFSTRAGEQRCRVVFDTVLNEVIHLDVMRAGQWCRAGADDRRDVGCSLKEANSEVLDDPVAEGYVLSDELPDWVTRH